MDAPKSPNKAIIASVVIVLLVVAATGIVALNSNKSGQVAQNDTAVTSQASTSASGTNNATASSGNYKDGTYTATGSYTTPGGGESIGVSLTIANGEITDASVTQHASGGEAEQYQEAFASDFKSEVVGKKLSEVSLSRVAGSSLTPIGFNNAVATIRSEAAS